MTAEIRQLTGARGIAAWYVVLYHIRLSVAGLPQPALDALAKGYLAVDFFFLLSGFVIWITWDGRLRGGGWPAVLEFWRRRIARIWPLHLAMLTMAAALALMMWVRGAPDPQFPIAALPLHILLLQAWGLGDLMLKWNDPAWSISAEAVAYLLFPALALRIDWRKMSTPAVLAALVILASVLSLAVSRSGAALLSDDIEKFALLRCVVEFTSGTAIAALWVRHGDQRGATSLLSAALGGALIASSLLGLAAEPFAMPLGLGALLLALASSDRCGALLGGRVFHHLGRISFATYLSHMVLWKLFKLAFLHDVEGLSPGMIGLYLLLVLVASIVLYDRVEWPAQRWINGLRRNTSARRALPGDAQNRLLG